MQEPALDLLIADWWISLYIANVIGVDIALWVPFAVIAIIVAVRYIRYKRSEVKISPLLGVLQPTVRPGKREHGPAFYKRRGKGL
jgi:hypothetical protein